VVNPDPVRLALLRKNHHPLGDWGGPHCPPIVVALRVHRPHHQRSSL